MSCLGFLLIALVGSVLCGESDLSKGRELGAYDSYDTDNPTYGYGYGPETRWQISSSPPQPPECGSTVRPMLIGLLLGALVKLPLLLLAKLFLLKLTAPLAVMGALLPLGVYSIYRAAVGGQQSTAPANSTARILPADCLKAAACGIGSAAPKAAVPTTSWLLKSMSDVGKKDWDSWMDISAYRDAYMKGATTKTCNEYPCPFF